MKLKPTKKKIGGNASRASCRTRAPARCASGANVFIEHAGQARSSRRRSLVCAGRRNSELRLDVFDLLAEGRSPAFGQHGLRIELAENLRLNAAEPSKVGSSESWDNPQTKSSGTSTILRVFNSGGMVCHLARPRIVVDDGRRPGHNYRFSWCLTPSGEWEIKS